ncbi:hypothetical protein BIW11_00150 [Tropilaelaps mercedesae]|uniref:Tudor domain-containing protein n=1 Tax=Tropilaelaps mercedesae TaxID=418985 RepID=A0A1V9Y125_9ACAR|nr:hypothetical protein BIW11_00150 [Tropilaelaps mercedesae]
MRQVQIPDQLCFSSLSLEMDHATRLTEDEKNYIKLTIGDKLEELLRIRFLQCIRQCPDRKSVSVSDFLDYFNKQNRLRGYRPLYCDDNELIKLFKALDHIFQVRFVPSPDGEAPRLFMPEYFLKEHEKVSLRTGGPSNTAIRRPAYDRVSPTKAPGNFQNDARVPVYVRKTLTTNELAKIVADFNKTLGLGRKICVEEYLAELDEFHPGVKGALQMRKIAIKEDAVDIIARVAEQEYPVRLFDRSYLMIGDPACYVNTYPYSSVFKLSKPPLPNSEPIRAEVTEVDKTSRNLLMYLTFSDDFGRRDKMHEQLEQYYTKKGKKVRPTDLRKGLPCVVPFDGTRDFHRAVIIALPSADYVRVLYIDFGTTADVAVASLRHLNGGFEIEPVFSRRAITNFEMSWADRISAALKILDKTVHLTVIGLSKKFDGALVVDVDELSSFATRVTPKEAPIDSQNDTPTPDLLDK